MEKNIQNEFHKRILNDKRMNKLFYGDGEVCFQVWILELEENNDQNYHWLYGRVLSVDYQNNKWTSDLSKHNKSISIESIKAKVIYLQLLTSADCLTDFIYELFKEKSFLEASTKIKSIIDKKLIPVLNLLKLPSPYCIRPVMHLPPRENYVWDTTKFSPNSEASYNSAAISLVNKTYFWNELNLSISKPILDMVSKKLKLDNIDIAGIDSWRFGDLEFLFSEGINTQEKKKFNLDLNDGVLTIYEQMSSNYLLIVLKVFNSDCLLFTLVKEVVIDEYPYILNFDIDGYNENIFDSYILEVFEKDNFGVNLLTQEAHKLVKTICIEVNANSNVSNPENDPWLEYGLPKSFKNKVKEFTSIERLKHHRSNFSVNREHKDLWFDTNIEIKKYLESILPKKSNSKFFPKLSFNGKSRLELVDWLKTVIVKYPNAQITWFDPFMENVGINLLNRLGSYAGNYIIVTSQTDNDQVRVKKLIEQCKNWAETIGCVRLKVIGLDKLHDRMILVREKSGKPLTGYHLSNSIQRANENHPLLVTEIPLDVLYLLFSYVDELIHSQGYKNIFDSSSYQSNNLKEEKLFDTQSPYQFPKLGWVLSKWWQRPELESLSGDTLRKRLLNMNIEITDSRDKYTDIPLVFFEDLLVCENFVEVWDAFGYLLAHIPADKYFYEIGNGHISDKLIKDLLFYLEPERENTLKLRFKPTVLDLNCCLKMGFDKLVCDVHPEQVFYMGSNEISYSDFYAIKILWCLSPKDIITWLDNQLNKFIPENNRQRALITDALRYISMDFSSLEKWVLMLKSKNSILQWIALNKIISLFFENKIDDVYVCKILNESTTIDRAKIFLWFIRESVFRKDEFRTLFLSEFIKKSDKPICNERLEELLVILRGRLGKLYDSYCWILDSVLEPMIECKFISYSQIINVWFQDLENDWNNAIRDSNNHVYFKEITEGVFSNEFVYLFFKLSEDEKNSILSRIEKIIKISTRIIRKPLSRAINYSLYINAFKVSMWILAILNRILEKEASSVILAQLTEFKELLFGVCQRYELIGNEAEINIDLLKYYNQY